MAAVADVEIQAPTSSSETGSSGGACGRNRHEREHTQGIAAARALGDLVAEDPAQQGGPIEPTRDHHRRGGGVIVRVIASAAVGSKGTTKERQTWAEDSTP